MPNSAHIKYHVHFHSLDGAVATEFGISHFSGAFLGSGGTLEKNSESDCKNFYLEHLEVIE